MKTLMRFGNSIRFKIHIFSAASIAISLILLLTLVGNLNIKKVEAAPSLPSGILSSIPIILTNNQAIVTQSPFQQMVTINSAAYSSKEASNLQNVEFFDSSGNIIPSWLESGNINSSTNSVYWLNLANGIAANTSITVYMGFASTATNLFNSQTTGEAPQLSSVYGQYDNGGNIFSYYDNFASSLSGWNGSTGVSASASNGLTINFSQNGYFTGPTENVGTAFDADVTANPSEINIGYINTNEPTATNYLGGPAWASSVIREACNNIYPDQLDQNTEANPCGGTSGSIITGSEKTNGIFSVDPISLSSSYQYVNYSNGNSTQPIKNNAPQYPCPVGFALMSGGTQANGMKVQWSRVRAAPPNGVMPLVVDTSLHPTIIASVPITLTNNQSSATPSHFQQMINIHSAAYSSEEASNLQNVEFLDGTGDVIPSWLESGNSNLSTNSVYWLSLANGIPANSSITIYMGFTNTSTNLFNASSIGEAPQLSPVYGEYDNGGNIFNYYNNFSSGISGWTASTGVSVLVNDGLNVNYNQNGYLIGPLADIGTAFDADITFNPSEINIGYIDTNEIINYLGGPAWAGSVIREACGNTYPDQLDQNAEANPCGSSSGSIFPGSESINGIFSVIQISSTSSYQFVNYSNGNSTQPIATHAPLYPCQVGFAQMRAGNINTSLNVQWVRVRTAPPNGVMPLVSVTGNVSSTAITLTSSANPSVSGQSVTFTASVNPIPDGGTVQFLDNGNNMGSPVTINSSGKANYTTSVLASGNHSITDVYSGDANYKSSTGNLTQEVNNASPPTISLGVPNINGLGASINGVTLPTVPGAVITGISWNWGDQTPAIIGWFPQTHTYNTTGNYTVTVTSTDSNGLTQTAQTTVDIISTTTQTATTVSASYNPSYSGGPVTFTANVSPIPPGGTVQFAVDGTSVGTAITIDSNGQATYQSSTLSVGKHTVGASYGGYNNIFSISSGNLAQIVNTQETPTISFGTTTIIGLSVSINGITLPNPTVPGAAIYGISWNWGDGQIIPGWFPQTHNYGQAGTYTITATSTDNYGQSQSTSVTETVSGTAIPTINTPLFAGADTISGTAQDKANISLTINGGTPYTTVSSGGVWAITVSPTSLLKTDVISVTAQASGQSVSSPATENVIPALNYAADLSNLVLSQPNISPVFSPTTYSYTESVSVRFLAFTPTWDPNINAAVTVNGTSIGNGKSITINLNIGLNTINIMVITANATEIYTFSVTRSTGPLVDVVVAPGPSTNLTAGTSQLFTVTGFYQDGSMANFTSNPIWVSDNTSVATINQSGLASGVATGTAYIYASISGISSPKVALVVGTTPPLSQTSNISTRTEELASGYYHNVGINSDGTVVAVGLDSYGQVSGVSYWTNIVQVACGNFFTVGLKSDGTVVAVGDNTYGECDVASWRNIVQISAEQWFVVGLTSNGTVVSAGDNNSGQCNVNNWTGIVQVAAESTATIGLKSDGTVVATGSDIWGQCDVSQWSGIIQVAGGNLFSLGLKSDGTVVGTGSDLYHQCDLSSWTGITQVTAGVGFSVGLKSDGTVVAVGFNPFGECNVSSWNGIIQIATGWYTTLGLKSDGTVVATGNNTITDSSGAGEATLANSWNLGCQTVTSIQGGGASVTQDDGVAVSITSANNGVIVNITSVNKGYNAPSQAGDDVNLGNGSAAYFDVKMTSNSDLGASAMATITISNSYVNPNSSMQFWVFNPVTNKWEYDTPQNLVVNVSASTISGEVPVLWLTGTPCAMGAAILNSIVVTHTTTTGLAVGSTEKFTATGAYSDGTNRNITSLVTWTSSDTSKAIITTGGLPAGTTIGIGAGITNIAATLNAITSQTNQTVTLTVVPASTTTLGTSATAIYSTSSQTVTLTAKVTATGALVNEGTVTFTVQSVGSPVTSSTVNGGIANATYTLPGGTPVGTYPILATYNPGQDFSGSSDNTATVVVNKANTSTVGANATAIYSGSNQTVNLSASISSTGGVMNEGTVTFTIKNGNTVIGKSVTSDIVSGGKANAAYTFPGGTTAGTYTIFTVYSGGNDFVSSSDNTKTLTINKAADQTFVISMLNPSTYGSQVTFTALVLPSSVNPGNIVTNNNGSTVLNTSSLATTLGNYIPTGSITFMDGSTKLGTVNLSKLGFVIFTTSSLATGSHAITAVYSGDNNYLPSTSSTLNQNMNKANSTISLTSGPNPTNSKTTVTFIATVNPTLVTGTINFMNGNGILGTVKVSAGKATLGIKLAAGNYSVTAVYSGDSNFNGSTSNTVKQTITK